MERRICVCRGHQHNEIFTVLTQSEWIIEWLVSGAVSSRAVHGILQQFPCMFSRMFCTTNSFNLVFHSRCHVIHALMPCHRINNFLIAMKNWFVYHKNRNLARHCCQVPGNCTQITDKGSELFFHCSSRIYSSRRWRDYDMPYLCSFCWRKLQWGKHFSQLPSFNTFLITHPASDLPHAETDTAGHDPEQSHILIIHPTCKHLVSLGF